MEQISMLQKALQGEHELGIIAVIGAFLIILFAVRSVITSVEIFFARKATLKNPTYANARRIYRLYSRWGVTVNNHPRDWGKLKELFYAINRSEQVPPELKQRIKTRFIRKGLYIDNVRIIDNYNGGRNTNA